MSKQILKPLSIALGATFAVSMAASNIAVAAPAGDNPFAMSELQSGYMQVAGKDGKDGKCGEGKCGEGKKHDAKGKDGKCGGSSKPGSKNKAKDGKCGEGKCGGDTKGKDGKDGKCGEGKCGGK